MAKFMLILFALGFAAAAQASVLECQGFKRDGKDAPPSVVQLKEIRFHRQHMSGSIDEYSFGADKQWLPGGISLVITNDVSGRGVTINSGWQRIPHSRVRQANVHFYDIAEDGSKKILELSCYLK